jgi:hypothetical protein
MYKAPRSCLVPGLLVFFCRWIRFTDDVSTIGGGLPAPAAAALQRFGPLPLRGQSQITKLLRPRLTLFRQRRWIPLCRAIFIKFLKVIPSKAFLVSIFPVTIYNFKTRTQQTFQLLQHHANKCVKCQQNHMMNKTTRFNNTFYSRTALHFKQFALACKIAFSSFSVTV